jgi:hypothetical protein
MFHPDLTIIPHIDGVDVAFPVTGTLGLDEGAAQPPQPRKDLRVAASIWQTEADTIHGGSATNIVAWALGEGKQDPDNLEQWSATVVTRKGPFKLDSPATGIGLIVENTGDPTGFETYTWTTRLQIHSH